MPHWLSNISYPTHARGIIVKYVTGYSGHSKKTGANKLTCTSQSPTPTDADTYFMGDINSKGVSDSSVLGEKQNSSWNLKILLELGDLGNFGGDIKYQ